MQNGILLPKAIGERFTFVRQPPPEDLAQVVEGFWIVRWDLRDAATHEQETLPHPCVNLVIGTHRPGVHGPVTSRFVAQLDGEGWVLGTKFRPAGFRGMLHAPSVELVDRTLTVAEAYGKEGKALEREVLAALDDRGRIGLVERFVRARHPGIDDDAIDTNRIVALGQVDSTITRVADLAARAGRQVRTIERMFRTYLGVPPKWVIRRFRVQEAATRLATGGLVDFPTLAQELGYFDQAHFIRDFKAQVGRTPAQYAKICAEG
jgi:AraC-like DNA-binding protein